MTSLAIIILYQAILHMAQHSSSSIHVEPMREVIAEE
jgi:hypothetical protein